MLVKTIVVIFTIFWTSCQACEPNETCEVDLQDPNVQALITGINTFTNSLMTLMFKDETMAPNINVSPVCAYASLVLILFGSTDKTQTELIAALGFPQADLNQLQTTVADIFKSLQVLRTKTLWGVEIPIEQLTLATALFIQREYTVVETYKELLLYTFETELKSVDFKNNAEGATRLINRWITNETAKRSPYFITKADPSTNLFLASAIYFSSYWKENLFMPTPVKGKFRNFKGEEKTLTKLKTISSLLYFDNTKSYSVVQLPFEADDFTMEILLPYGDRAINDFLKTFTIEEYMKDFGNAKEALVDCQIPIFWSNSANLVTEIMKKNMNINQMFTKANLGNMIEGDKGDLSVSVMYQIGGIVINEVGVSAAAVGTVDIGEQLQEATGNMGTAVPFDVDRPFLTLIRHKQTNMVVFVSLTRQI